MNPSVLWTKRAAKRALNFGVSYRCNLCGARLRRLLPASSTVAIYAELNVVGGGRRQNVMCPVCYANDRVRLTCHYICAEADPPADATVLHMGPELVLAQAPRRRFGRGYVAGDLVPQNYREIPDVVRVDLTDIPFPDRRFDIVIANEIMEHIPDDRRAMREVCRVLKPGGFAIMTTSIARGLPATIEDPGITDPAERRRRFGQTDHVRIYALDYKDRLQEAGFEVREFNYAEKYGEQAAAAFPIEPRYTLYVGYRPAAVH